jgi:hypothetical membrane protein
MEGIKRRIEKLKRIHYLVSLGLFVLTLCFCSYTASDLNLMHISLSHFGIYNKIGVIWNTSLFIVGITLFVEAWQNIKKYALGKTLLYLFGISVFCLFLTACITMTHKIHFYSAYTYFIGYTFGIFLFGFRTIRVDFRIGITSIIIAITSVICPVAILLQIHSFAIPELAHTGIVFNWVIVTRFDNEYKEMLKRIGL